MDDDVNANGSALLSIKDGLSRPEMVEDERLESAPSNVLLEIRRDVDMEDSVVARSVFRV